MDAISATKVSISPEDVLFILEELESNYPFEACGVIVGIHEKDVVSVKRTVPVNNSRRTQRSFELDPMEFYRVWDDAEKDSMDVVGVYHTHPDGLARPSYWDRKSMENSPPIWIIAGIDGVFAYRLIEGEIMNVDII